MFIAFRFIRIAVRVDRAAACARIYTYIQTERRSRKYVRIETRFLLIFHRQYRYICVYTKALT